MTVAGRDSGSIRFPVELDSLSLRVDANSERRHDLTVDRHAPGADGLLHRPPRPASRPGQEYLKPQAAVGRSALAISVGRIRVSVAR